MFLSAVRHCVETQSKKLKVEKFFHFLMNICECFVYAHALFMCLVPGEAIKMHWHHGNCCCRGLKPPGSGAWNPNLVPLQEQFHLKIVLLKVFVL